MLDQRVLEELQDYVQSHQILEMNVCEASYRTKKYDIDDEQDELEDFIKENKKPTMKEVLFAFIDKKDVPDSEIYKKAGMDRRHFSKIRSNPDYRIGKNAAIALALALELTKKETDKLLGSAGYSLSDSDTSDLVIQFFIKKKIYNIHEVNQALDHFHIKPLI